MAIRFEKLADLEREKLAVETFVGSFKSGPGSFIKLGPNDIDYKIFNSSGDVIAYAEIKGRNRTICDAFPLPCSLLKIAKLAQMKINPVIIWACQDGIIYGQIYQLEGGIKWGGREPREGAANDRELMAYYPQQNGLYSVKYPIKGETGGQFFKRQPISGPKFQR